ncbi:MAG TPA: hypothetical protein VGC09_06370, partial [Rhodopila sp.]
MTALAQGSAGLALVMCFALLRTGQLDAAAILLAVQSGAVAVTAVVLQQPLMAIPPVLLATGTWLARRYTPVLDPRTAPAGGAKPGICAGAVLAILCQSQGGLALPLAIILLSILLAATRSHPLMQVLALVAMQNGLALGVCLLSAPALLAAAGSPTALPWAIWLLPSTLLPAIACLLLPLPLAAGLLVPAVASSSNHLALPPSRSWLPNLPNMAAWFGWIDLGVALVMFAATLSVPLDSLASVFAPLLGLDGVIRSCARLSRPALTPIRRTAFLAQTGLGLLAVCPTDLSVAWLAVLAAMAAALLPTISRRWGGAVLAFLAAGTALLGITLLPAAAGIAAPALAVPAMAVASTAAPGMLGFFSLFVGFALIAAVIPELAVVLTILLLRLATRTPWAQSVEILGMGIAIMALLACALLLTNRSRAHRTSLLVLSQASIALLAICSGQAEGRFAALVLLILLILCRSATRLTGTLAATLARAGLGGIPPLGMFPALVLVALTFSGHDPWLLVPFGVALISMVLASVPRPPLLKPRPPASLVSAPLASASLASASLASGPVASAPLAAAPVDSPLAAASLASPASDPAPLASAPLAAAAPPAA